MALPIAREAHMHAYGSTEVCECVMKMVAYIVLTELVACRGACNMAYMPGVHGHGIVAWRRSMHVLCICTFGVCNIIVLAHIYGVAFLPCVLYRWLACF